MENYARQHYLFAEDGEQALPADSGSSATSSMKKGNSESASESMGPEAQVITDLIFSYVQDVL
jgi:hypothetical protein